MRDSLLPLEGDTVQFLAAAGAAASLLPLLRSPFPGAAAVPGPAAPSPPQPQGPAAGAQRFPEERRRARGVSPATCACA